MKKEHLITEQPITVQTTVKVSRIKEVIKDIPASQEVAITTSQFSDGSQMLIFSDHRGIINMGVARPVEVDNSLADQYIAERINSPLTPEKNETPQQS